MGKIMKLNSEMGHCILFFFVSFYMAYGTDVYKNIISINLNFTTAMSTITTTTNTTTIIVEINESFLDQTSLSYKFIIIFMK